MAESPSRHDGVTMADAVCPICDTRYLGEQWCPDCQQFCHRLGPGSRCPHCNEPVALVDLLPLEKGGDGAPR